MALTSLSVGAINAACMDALSWRASDRRSRQGVVMKRSRSIELVFMGTVPLLLSACDNPSPPQAQPQTAMAYQGLTQCINDGKVSADVCEKAYADAVAAQYRDGPRFDSLGDCEAQYG